ncbi:MAG: GGDEF domain-containing protein [Planctomycetota bacterium]|nr:GGDEF domain-containing protein [Planctomycetota bacterium]
MILLADHRGAGLERIRNVLEDAGRPTVLTNSLRETREALEANEPELIVLDPLSEGGQVEIEQIELFCLGDEGTSLLLVTTPAELDGSVEMTHRVEGAIWDLIHREAPADEYLLRIDRLLHQVAYRDEVEELRYRASYDWTGLLRKEAFEERLEELFSAAGRHNFEIALAVIDLDRFGRVNKIFDHTVGDLVISRVGDAIRNALRTEDLAFRLGGDEFGIILPFTGAVEAAHVCVRLRDAIWSVGDLALSGALTGRSIKLPVSASIGFQVYSGGHPVTRQELRAHAEKALQAAKRSGGNRAVYHPSLNTDQPSLDTDQPSLNTDQPDKKP